MTECIVVDLRAHIQGGPRSWLPATAVGAGGELLVLFLVGAELWVNWTPSHGHSKSSRAGPGAQDLVIEALSSGPHRPERNDRHLEEPSVVATPGVLDALSPSCLCREVEGFTDSVCLHTSGDEASP